MIPISRIKVSERLTFFFRMLLTATGLSSVLYTWLNDWDRKDRELGSTLNEQSEPSHNSPPQASFQGHRSPTKNSWANGMRSLRTFNLRFLASSLTTMFSTRSMTATCTELALVDEQRTMRICFKHLRVVVCLGVSPNLTFLSEHSTGNLHLFQ